ncbi:Dual specificity protein phosphatase 7 [Hypsibius exemplaris]|uniref:protein-tyrosine-phosphatase n=1 Tax=Hypsibius exemplaris TaxID=2072580 RepID=A0A1W0X9Z1_HYPEX|nr:Dual specificity protein phosphatase 7 [Hypsibius exemplaris]
MMEDLHVCDSEWLHAQLDCPNPAVLLLDCRSHVDFSQKGHVISAINIQLPALMLKRLTKGSLSVPAVIKCQEARDVFLAHWKTDWVCLYDEGAAAHPSDSCNSIMKTLGLKLQEEGCRVLFLTGGYQRFNESYPEQCVFANGPASPTDDKAAVLGLKNLRITNSSSDQSEFGECDSGYSKETDLQRDCWHGVELFEILPYLYLGNAETAQDLKTLQDFNIRYILNVTPNLPNVFETETELGFKYMQIPIQDCLGENLAAYFDEAIEFIEEAQRHKWGCLVHCRAGISRSVTVTVAYIMQKFSVPLNSAYDFVKSKKANVSPNFNFMGQLLEFERRLNILPAVSSACRNVPQSADEGLPWSPELSAAAATPATASVKTPAHDLTTTTTRLPESAGPALLHLHHHHP